MCVLGTAVKQRPAIGDGSRPHGKVVIDVKGMISSAIKDASSDIHDHSEDRLLRPLAGYTGFNSEMRELAAVIAKVRCTVSVRRVGWTGVVSGMVKSLNKLHVSMRCSASVSSLFACRVQDIYLHSPNVRWDDIVGLSEAKRLIKEAVVYPIKVSWTGSNGWMSTCCPFLILITCCRNPSQCLCCASIKVSLCGGCHLCSASSWCFSCL